MFDAFGVLCSLTPGRDDGPEEEKMLKKIVINTCHGGFSLITSFVMLGMLMAFSHRNALDRRRDAFEVKS